MKTVNGIFASAKVFADGPDAYALAQIQMICDHPASRGSKIRVMPDVHPGKVGTIGLTMTVGGSILPNLVGIDIGCGITLVRIKQKKVEFQKLDTVIRENIPAGFGIRKKIHRFYENFDTTRLYCHRHLNQDRTARRLGTLGGGNHFIELDKDSSGSLYAAVHSGSRHLGKEVTEYYLQQGQKALKEQGIQVPYELTVLDGALKEAYLHDQQIVQEYAALNRAAILDEMIKGMKWKVQETISCSHNYIEMNSKETSFAGGILRKGAVSAKKGEPVIIPVNMRDGILLGTGKGNEDWNYSAPHGSGRILRRDMVKEKYTVSDFKNEMKGIYCPCIGKETLDEAPFAYRGMEKIMEAIGDAAEITQVLKPVYSFKAGN